MFGLLTDIFAALIIIIAVLGGVMAILGLVRGVYQPFSHFIDCGSVENQDIYKVYTNCMHPTGGGIAAFILDMAHKGYIGIRKNTQSIVLEKTGRTEDCDPNTKELIESIFSNASMGSEDEQTMPGTVVRFEDCAVSYYEKANEIIAAYNRNAFHDRTSMGLKYMSTKIFNVILLLLVSSYVGLVTVTHGGIQSFARYSLHMIVVNLAIFGSFYIARNMYRTESIFNPNVAEEVVRTMIPRRYGRREFNPIAIFVGLFMVSFVAQVFFVVKFIEKYNTTLNIMFFVITAISFVIMLFNDFHNEAKIADVRQDNTYVNVVWDKTYTEETVGEASNIERLYILMDMVKDSGNSKKSKKETESMPSWFFGYEWEGMGSLMNEINDIIYSKR